MKTSAKIPYVYLVFSLLVAMFLAPARPAQAQSVSAPSSVAALNSLPATHHWYAIGGNANDYFGAAVSSAGDVNGDGYADVLITASGFDGGQTDEGRVYLYYGSASGLGAQPVWTMELNVADAGLDGLFAAGAGDINGDGYADIVISAPNYYASTLGGAAWAYYGSAAGLSATSDWFMTLNAGGPAMFGDALSSAGDVNQDGYDDVIVGCRWCFGTGAAYIYHGSANGLSGAANRVLYGEVSASRFGKAVSAAGDVNSDGYADVLVGAPIYNAGSYAEGKVYLYYGSASGVNSAPAWTARGMQADSEFGSSVAAAGDVNGDGYDDVLVAARRYDNGEMDEGAIFVWHGSATGLTPNGTPANANWMAESNVPPPAGDIYGGWLGSGATGIRDVNGDGYADILAGTELYRHATGKGAAFAWYGSASGLGPNGNLTNADWAIYGDGQFGASVSSAGDVNGDGSPDVIIGAYLRYAGAGAAYVYHSSVDDVTPPTGSILINGDADYTNTPAVTLNLSATDNVGVTEMRLSNGGAWNAWEAYTTTRAWTLASGDGTKWVYVQYRDAAGNISTTYVDSIVLVSSPTLVAAVLAFDNNLDPYTDEVIEKFRLGTVGRSDLSVFLLVDRFGDGNTTVVEIHAGVSHIKPEIPWLAGTGIAELDTATPDTLAAFFTWARAQAPTARSVVSLLGHGVWTGPDVNIPWDLPAEAPGMLQSLSGAPFLPRGRDFTSGDVTSRSSLSTPDLGAALRAATSDGAQPFDLLFLDQCFGGTLDTLYEIRATAEVIIASSNYAWAAHAYDQYLPALTADKTAAQMAQAIVDAYEAALDESHPNHIFWVASADIAPLATAADGLADALIQATDAGYANLVLAATLASAFKDTTQAQGDLRLAPPDELVDLASLAQQLQTRFPYGSSTTATQVYQAAQTVREALNVLHSTVRNGAPWPAPYTTWDFTGAALGVIAPLTPTWVLTPELLSLASLYRPAPFDAVWLFNPEQQIPITTTMAYVQAGRWDEFIQSWYGRAGTLTPVVGLPPNTLPAILPRAGTPEPLSLSASVAGNTVALTWNAASAPGAARYAVYVRWPGTPLATWLDVRSLSEPRTVTHANLPLGDFVYWVTAQDADGVVLALSAPVTATIRGQTWYVGAGSTQALGAGMSSNTLASIQAAIERANPGDTIKVAAGTYDENLQVDAYHYGLTLEGGYNPANWSERDIETYPTIINGGGGASCLDLFRTHDVTVSGFWMTNAERLIRVYPAHNITIERNYLHDTTGSNYTSGIDVESVPDYETHDVLIRNNVIWNIVGPGTRGGGVDVAHHQGYPARAVQVVNNTIFNVSQDGILMGKWDPVYGAVIENNIVLLAGDTGIQIYDVAQAGTVDYNAVYNVANSYVGAHDVQTDPRLVNPEAGDFHLLPDSPCIDAGDPTFDYSREPQPNGGRINIGAYGNTELAAPSVIASLVLEAASGLTNISLHWTATNDPWVSAYRVYRAASSAGPFALIATVAGVEYVDADLALSPGAQYTYYVEAVRSNGQVVAASNLAQAVFGALTLVVPDVWGFPGQSAVIPVSLRNAQGLTLDGADIWLEYDPALLTPIGVESTALTAGYTWNYAIPQPGRLHIILMHAGNALYGDGALFWITVQVNGSQGQSAPLHLLPFGEPGTALYVNGNYDTPAPLILADGMFYVENYQLGDLNADTYINVADVLWTLEISVGARQPQPWQQYACDVNNNTACDPGDAAMIWYRALHLQWPAPTVLLASSSPATAPRLRLGAATGGPGSIVEVPLYAEALSAWAAQGLSIAYDPRYVAEVVAIETTAATAGFALDYTDAAGLVRLSLASSENGVLSGPIAVLRLRLRADAPGGVMLLKLAGGQVYDVAGREFAANLQQPVVLEDGQIEVRGGYRVYLPLLLKQP